MKSVMLLVVFIILGLMGARAILNYGFYFDLSHPNSKLIPSGYEYLLVGSLIGLLLFLMRVYEDKGESPHATLAVGISLLTATAFWVIVRLSWLLLGHGALMSTGKAGLIIPGQTEGLAYLYPNLLANLALLFTGIYVLTKFKRLNTLTVVSLCSLFLVVGWPLAILMLIVLTIIAACLGVGIKKGLGLMGKLAGLSENKPKTRAK